MGSTSAARRVQKELADFMRTEDFVDCGVHFELVEDSLLKLKGKIAGPADTPYEGGIFNLEIIIPALYPFFPPRIRLVTKVWHPNIRSENGSICLDVLGDKWTASMTLRTALLSLRALLSLAEPDDPVDEQVAHQYKLNHEIFQLTARYWTKIYAGGNGSFPDFDDKVERLVKRGFDVECARQCLSRCSWNVDEAIDVLSEGAYDNAEISDYDTECYSDYDPESYSDSD